MTVYVWDASHFDGVLSKAILARAKAEGIVSFVHKLGEGLTNTDPTAATALAAARDVGIGLLGGYWFNHGNDQSADEVAAFIAEADRHEPWWRDFPGWYWEADLETSPTGLPSPAWAREFCDRLADQTGRVVFAYASHGQYGDRLAGLGHPLWNAHYPSSRQAPFKDLYPGDNFAGWAPYSGQTPLLLQYASSATIAGLSTCDISAYRGTLAQFTDLITGGSMTTVDLTPAAITAVRDAILAAPIFVRPAGEQTDDGLSLAWAARGAYFRAGKAANDQLPDVQGRLAQLGAGETAEAVTLAGIKAEVDALTPAAFAAAVIAELPQGGAATYTPDEIASAVVTALGRTQISVTVAPPPAG